MMNWIHKLQRLGIQKQHSLDLPLQHGCIREACGVRDDKVPLVPRRVVPHIFFQKVLHKLQLVVPQFVLLHSEQNSKHWQHAPAGGIRADATTTNAERHSARTHQGGSEEGVFSFGREGPTWAERLELAVCTLSGRESATSSHTYLDDPLSVLPGVVVLCILAEDVGDELQLLWRVIQPLHHHTPVMPVKGAAQSQSGCVMSTWIGRCFLVVQVICHVFSPGVGQTFWLARTQWVLKFDRGAGAAADGWTECFGEEKILCDKKKTCNLKINKNSTLFWSLLKEDLI